MTWSKSIRRRKLLVGVVGVGLILLVAVVGVVLLTDRGAPKEGETTLELSDEWRSVRGVRDVVAVERSRRVPGEDVGEADRWEHSVDVEVSLEEELSVADAAVAGEVVRVLAPEIARLAPDAGAERTSVLFSIGSAELRVGGGLADATADAAAEAVGDGLGDAVALREAGATEVSLTLSPTAAGVADQAQVRAPEETLVEVATVARSRERPVDLVGGDAWYRSHELPDLAAVRLVRDAGEQPEVTSAQLASYAPLVVLVDAAEGDGVIAEVGRWLTAYPGWRKKPLEFSVEGTRGGGAEGWVGGKTPPQTTMPQFGDAEPWPADPAAPACRTRDLEVVFGGYDGAAGSRQASLHARNVGDRACAVEGVPTVEFLDAGGAEQVDVTIDPYEPSMVPERVVVPAGESVTAVIDWQAMSTANDPGVTTDLRVRALPGGKPVTLPLPLGSDEEPIDLDVLDGAEVRISPWAQGAPR